MGSHVKGILGTFKGTIGTVVGSTWKGKAVMRSRPGPRKKPLTQAQQEVKAKFELIMRFLLTFRNILKKSFPSRDSRYSGLNEAFRRAQKDAITGQYPSLLIDYSKVVISEGAVAEVNMQSVTSQGGNLTFNWINNAGAEEGANADDKAMLVVYCEELKKSVSVSQAALRSAGAATVAVQRFAGKLVQTWISFLSADGTDVSTSQYTGSYMVS